MRLDLLLKEARIIKRRTIAKEFCLKGLVSVNGKVAKPSYEVKDNDVLDITLGPRVVTVLIYFEVVGKKTIIHVEEVSGKKNGASDA